MENKIRLTITTPDFFCLGSIQINERPPTQIAVSPMVVRRLISKEIGRAVANYICGVIEIVGD